MRYHYTVELPFTKTVLTYREITTEEQLDLGKAQYSFSDNSLGYFKFVYNIVENCVSNKDDLSKIDIIEFILFSIKLRIVSVGSSIELYSKIDGQNTKITLDLNTLLKNIYTLMEKYTYDFSHNAIRVKIGFPYIADLPEFLSLENDFNSISETFPLFIKDITPFKFKSKWSDLSTKSKRIVFGNLPVSLSNEIQTNILKTLKGASEEDIFALEIFKDFRINMYNNTIHELIKLVCSYDIKSIHSEIYVLSSLGPNYIKSLSPNERKIYLSLYIQDKNTKGNSSNPSEGATNEQTSPVDALSLEFGQSPINS